VVLKETKRLVGVMGLLIAFFCTYLGVLCPLPSNEQFQAELAKVSERHSEKILFWKTYDDDVKQNEAMDAQKYKDEVAKFYRGERENFPGIPVPRPRGLMMWREIGRTIVEERVRYLDTTINHHVCFEFYPDGSYKNKVLCYSCT
jgi:hypothetical protein